MLLGIDIHWILVQHDDPDHPLLGWSLHPASSLQKQPSLCGWGGHPGQHPDQRYQGEGDVNHPYQEQGANEERGINSSRVHRKALPVIFFGFTKSVRSECVAELNVFTNNKLEFCRMDTILAANVLFKCLSQAWCIFRELGDSLTRSQHLTLWPVSRDIQISRFSVQFGM